MPNDIDKLMDIKNDSTLCNEIFDRIVNHYGSAKYCSKFMKHEQVVVLTWQVSGIIGNGGFHYLFEGYVEDWFGKDPYLTNIVAAFKTIKATKCAEAVEEVLGLFSNSKLPMDIKKRLAIYETVPEATLQVIERKFFGQSENIPALLASYIRKNKAKFESLSETRAAGRETA